MRSPIRTTLEGEIDMSTHEQKFETLITAGHWLPISEAPLDEQSQPGDWDDPTFAQPDVPARKES
jgi:hypothetical protein